MQTGEPITVAKFRRRLLKQLLPWVQLVSEREALLAEAYAGIPWMTDDIRREGTPREFASHLFDVIAARQEPAAMLYLLQGLQAIVVDARATAECVALRDAWPKLHAQLRPVPERSTRPLPPAPARSTTTYTAGVVAIYGNGRPVGAGFVVSRVQRLVVTCAHVLRKAGWSEAAAGTPLQIRYHAVAGKGRYARAVVDLDRYSPPEDKDVAILRVITEVPEVVEALSLMPAQNTLGHTTFSFGYPEGQPDGLGGEGRVVDVNLVRNPPRLQFNSPDVTFGYSGGPVWDHELQHVIGMVSGAPQVESDGRLQYVTFGVPAETINDISNGLLASPTVTAAVLDDDAPILFICHDVRHDRRRAQWLADALNDAGHQAVISHDPGQGDEAWLSRTTHDIRRAYAVIVLLSRGRQPNAELLAAHLFALDRLKPVILALDDGVDVPDFTGDNPVIREIERDAGWRQLLAVLPPRPEYQGRLRQPPPFVARRLVELRYMARLQLEELRQTARYTPLSGHVKVGQRTQGGWRVEPVVASQSLSWLQQAHADVREAAVYIETDRFDDAVKHLTGIRRAILLGEPGSGKSTTLRRLAADLVDEARRDRRAAVPLLFAMGEWREPESELSLLAFLQRQMGDLGPHLDDLLAEARVWLLLDGINEIPPDQHEDKYRAIRQWLEGADMRSMRALVSCRERDYPDARDLGLDRVVISPLNPLQVRAFVNSYLGDGAGKTLFWKLAGPDVERTYARFLAEVGSALAEPDRTFWLAGTLPDGKTWGYNWDKNRLWEQWLRERAQPDSLLRLAFNPYMLMMLVGVFAKGGDLPRNRGALFASFVESLLLREELAAVIPDGSKNVLALTPFAERLLPALAELALAMQQRRTATDERASQRGALTIFTVVEARQHLDESQLHAAASANLLAVGTDVRFSHQLLQEYFVARAMQRRVFPDGGDAALLGAEDIWLPDGEWWNPTGWEEATILLAGLYSKDCTPVLRWVASANPQVAVRCYVESGAAVSDEKAILEELRELWTPRLADIERFPDARARAAVGRALGLIYWKDGRPLDGRKGVAWVMRGEQRVPDIAWGEVVPAGPYTIGDDKEAYQAEKRPVTIDADYQLSRYPITYAQFDCFVRDPNFGNDDWWRDMPPEGQDWLGTVYQLREMSEQEFKFANHPRETVSWYQAIAFCRWLRKVLNDPTIDLPTEEQWEVAARYNDDRFYPWGNEFEAERANIGEGNSVGRTTAVGIYPTGAHRGLHDLSGNVWEWCRNDYDKPENTDVRPAAARRVLRGGSWDLPQNLARAASRSNIDPAARYNNRGFRVVRRPPSRDL